MTRARELAWIAVPLLAYAVVLQHFWADAPIWDDYGSVLESLLRMMDARSAGEWIGIVVSQHNEHRIATMRLAARAVLALLGHIDFRVLVLLVDLSFLGTFLLIRDAFRDQVPAPLFAAAAFLMFQWSSYEAGLWTTGGLGNMGVAFFGFACLYLATRGEAPGAAACIACGIAAVGLAANGLFALPMAAAMCALTGRRRRAAVLAIVGVALWLLYFHGYARPPNHPSPMVAFTIPIDTAHLFLIVVGGIAPGEKPATYAGSAILIVLAWLTWKGAWKANPLAGAWVAFVLLTAAAASAGRVGFGVFHASRYAVYSTCLVVIAFLSAYTVTKPWSRAAIAVAIVASAGICAVASRAVWHDVREFVINGQLLAKEVPAGGGEERYVGMYFPNLAMSARILDEAEARGIYVAPRVTSYPPAMRSIATLPAATVGGVVDRVQVEGSRVDVIGWTAIPATVADRIVSVYSRAAAPLSMQAQSTPREDVARVLLAPALVLSGLHLELDYADAAQAKGAADSLCLLVEAPGHPVTILGRADASCPARESRP